jgi:signal transduction histidine kinase
VPLATPPWSAAAIDRYETELEGAQARIRELERQLAQGAPMPGVGPSPRRGNGKEHVAAAPRETSDAATTLEAALDAVNAQLQAKGLRVYLDIGPNLPPVPMEREKLLQVMSHLLENACQASPDQGLVAVRAQAALADENAQETAGVAGFLQLSVQDSGMGVRPSDQARVFEPHFKAATPAISGIGDTGIGLSIVKSLVQAHGGRVWVEGTAGQGSTFKVLLPLAVNGTTHGPG